MAADPRVQAHALLTAHQIEPARELLRAFLAQQPTDSTALLLLAAAESAAGDPTAAEELAHLVLADPSHRAEAAGMIARLTALDPARAAEGVSWAAEAVRLRPDDPRDRSLLAECLCEVKDHVGAYQQACIAVDLAGPDVEQRFEALSTLARVMVRDPAQRGRALAVAEEAAALDPTDTRGAEVLAVSQVTAGKRAEAMVTSLRVLRSSPTAVAPPFIARLALHLLVRRTLGWLLPVVVLVPILFVGFFSEPLGWAMTSRVGGVAGLAAFALVGLLTLRPLREPAVARAVWLFAKRRPTTWIVGALVGLALAGYLSAVVLGFPGGLIVPFLLVPLTWLVHSASAAAIHVPTADGAS